MMGSNDAALDTMEEKWVRLSPIGIAFFINKFIFRFIREGLQSALPAIAVLIATVDNKLFWASILLPIILSFIVLIAIIYWWHYKFCILPNEILLDQGVIKKQRLNLDFSRIQNVNVSVPFYFAPFNLVNCIFDSAGSAKSEVSLPGVSKEFAEEVRGLVFAYKQKAHANIETMKAEGEFSDQQAGSVTLNQQIVKLSNLESAKYGLTSMLALFLIVAVLPFMESIGSFVAANILPSVSAGVQLVVSDVVLAEFIAVILIVLGGVLSVIGFSVISALLRFYNFELYDDGDKLTRFIGLFERHQMSVSKHKVQAVEVKQNIIARLLNRVSLNFKQANPSVANPMVKDKHLLVPMMKPDQWHKASERVFKTKAGQETFESIHRSYLRRVFLYFQFLPFGLLFSMLAFIDLKFLWGLLILLPLAVILYGLYRGYGIWADDEYCAIRQGILGRKTTFFPLFKIQQLSYRQSRGQRRLGVASITIIIASGKLTLPYVSMKTVLKLYNQALYLAESDNKNWL